MIENDRYNNLDIYITEGLDEKINFSNTLKHIETAGNIDIGLYSVIDKYINLLKQFSVKIKLTDAEYDAYCYRPKFLSYRLYGTIEFWYILLKLNNVIDIQDFNKKDIIIFNPNNIDVLHNIFIKENITV